MPSSDTPRVDLFVSSLPTVILGRDDVEMGKQIRALMISWATFARELERENAQRGVTLREAMMAVSPADLRAVLEKEKTK